MHFWNTSKGQSYHVIVFTVLREYTYQAKYLGNLDLVDRYEISVSQMTTDMFPRVLDTSRSFPHS